MPVGASVVEDEFVTHATLPSRRHVSVAFWVTAFVLERRDGGRVVWRTIQTVAPAVPEESDIVGENPFLNHQIPHLLFNFFKFL
jgi:hypothetical protein